MKSPIYWGFLPHRAGDMGKRGRGKNRRKRTGCKEYTPFEWLAPRRSAKLSAGPVGGSGGVPTGRCLVARSECGGSSSRNTAFRQQ